MAILKSLTVLASIVGLVGISTFVRRSIDPSTSQVCDETTCQFCNTEGLSVGGSCSSGECSGGDSVERIDGKPFVFEGQTPACSACAHEPSLVSDGEVVPGEITDTEDVLGKSLDENIVTATDVTFAEHVNSESGLVLVDFYADWCGPCKIQGTILAEYARSNPDVTVVKVNVDDSPELAAKFKISGIPALRVFRGDGLAAEHVGVADTSKLDELLRQGSL